MDRARNCRFYCNATDRLLGLNVIPPYMGLSETASMQKQVGQLSSVRSLYISLSFLLKLLLTLKPLLSPYLHYKVLV